MLKAYTNKYNSYQAIQGTLNDNRSLYEDNIIMQELVNEFMELKDEIIRVAGKSDHKTNEMTREKYRLKEEMAEKAYALASAGIVYAMDVDDPELKSKLSANYSKIKYAKDAEAYGYAGGIESTLRKHIDRLAMEYPEFGKLYFQNRKIYDR